MKKILVPTDFSEFADMATEVAILLAKNTSAEIHFVHLMDIPVDWVNLIGEDQKEWYPDVTSKVKLAHKKLGELTKKVEKARVKAKTLIQFNANYNYLIEYSNTFSCDLIVMGSHGTSGIAEWFIGSNTQKVVRNSKVPVITIKHRFKSTAIDEIVFVSDFEQDNFRSFKFVLDFARIMRSKIHLLFINTPSNFTGTPIIEKRMKFFIIEGGDLIAKTAVFNSDNFMKGLEYSMSKSNQFLAIATHSGKNTLTEKVINHLDNPILSIPI